MGNNIRQRNPNPQKPKLWHWLIEKVIMPFLLALIPGYFLLLSTGVIDNPFTPLPTPTPIYPSDTPTLMDLDDSPTPTPTITATYTFTSTSTHTPTPTSKSLATIFEDTFIDNQNFWFVNSDTYIGAGKYSFEVGCPANYLTYYCGTYVNVPFDFPKDFQMEIDIEVPESSNDANIALGFQIRRNDKNHYYINYFITDMYYVFHSAYNTNDLEIIPKTSTTLINTGSNVVNRFGIEVRDTKFTPIINGNRLTEGEDGNMPDAGQTYLVIYILRGSWATIKFDNLIVKEVK